MHHRFEPTMGKIGETGPKFLFAGDYPVITRNILVRQGHSLSYGSLLGRDNEGKYKLAAKDAEDGSADLQGILTEDVDANSQDKEAIIYLTGQFNYNAMVFGDGYHEDGIPTQEATDKLRQLNIFLEKGVKAQPRT